MEGVCDEQPRDQEVCEGRVWAGGVAGETRRQFLLWIGFGTSRSHYVQSLRGDGHRGLTGGGRLGFARLWESHGAGRTQAWRDSFGSGVRRWNRCLAVGPSGWTDRYSVWARYDGRDARLGTGESADIW